MNRLRFSFRAGLALWLVLSAGVGVVKATTVPTTQMGPHMETTLAAAQRPGDAERANAILAAARSVMSRYPTVESAQAAGFYKFLPGIPLPIEHYTNRAYALDAWLGHFDPEHPTSLIFERKGGALRLVGVMYTASNTVDRNELNARVPLSFGTWHRHVNFCKAPLGTPLSERLSPTARFGFNGSIHTSDACAAAGGTFKPVVFGWMVHVWPNEKTRAEIWAVDRRGSMERSGAMTMDSH